MQSINVNIVPGDFPQILRYSQGDVGREFRINVVDFDIPTGATVTIVATKPSGFGFTAAGTVTDNVVSFVTTEDMTDEYGKFPAEVRITNGTTLLGTANFMFIGEKNPHPDGTVDGMQGTIIPELTLLVNEIRESNAKVESMTASAVALPSGSDPTAEYNATDNNLEFGIPVVDLTNYATKEEVDEDINDLKSDLDDSIYKAPIIRNSEVLPQTVFKYPEDFELYKQGYYIDDSGAEHPLSTYNIYKVNVKDVRNAYAIMPTADNGWSLSTYVGRAFYTDGTSSQFYYVQSKPHVINNAIDYVLVNINISQNVGANKIIVKQSPDTSFINDSEMSADITDLVAKYRYEDDSGNIQQLNGARVVKIVIDHKYDYYFKGQTYQVYGNFYKENDTRLASISISGNKIIIPDEAYYMHVNLPLDGFVYFKLKSEITGERKNKYPHSVNKPIDLTNKTMVAFGDSITAGVGSPNLIDVGQNSYINLLKAKYSIDLTNLAVSGTTITHTEGSSNNICDKVANYTTQKDIVLISGGVNDYNQGKPLGSYGDTSNTTFYGAMYSICTALKTNLPNAEVIFISPLPETMAVANAVAEVNDYRNAIYEVATKFGYNVVNGGLLGFTENRADWNSSWSLAMQADHLHPTVDGHALYFRNLCGALG